MSDDARPRQLVNAPEMVHADHNIDPRVCRECRTRLYLIRVGRETCAPCDLKAGRDPWRWVELEGLVEAQWRDQFDTDMSVES